MHDPMVVAFEIRRPWPRRYKFYDAKPNEKRWERVGLGSWRIAGRGWGSPGFITIWHVEPDGRDSGEVCKQWANHKPRRRWKWHVWHWHIQVGPIQSLKRWLFERCIECGRGYPWNYTPIAHQWNGPGPRWRRQQVNYHHECSSLVMLRRNQSLDHDLIRRLVAEIRVRADEDEPEVLDRLSGADDQTWPFQLTYRLQNLLGYERDERYRLVRKADA